MAQSCVPHGKMPSTTGNCSLFWRTPCGNDWLLQRYKSPASLPPQGTTLEGHSSSFGHRTTWALGLSLSVLSLSSFLPFLQVYLLGALPKEPSTHSSPTQSLFSGNPVQDRDSWKTQPFCGLWRSWYSFFVLASWVVTLKGVSKWLCNEKTGTKRCDTSLTDGQKHLKSFCQRDRVLNGQQG